MTQEQISMKHYVDTCVKGLEEQIRALEKLNTQRDELHALAIKEARDSMLTRLEGMNQFRDQIKEERANYVTKDALTSSLAAIRVTVNTQDKNIQKQEVSNSFSAGKVWMITAIIAAIPTILAIIALIRK